MDILDIFLDILLKPPQPLMGLFLLWLLVYATHGTYQPQEGCLMEWKYPS